MTIVIGVLGAADVADIALLTPTTAIDGIEVGAIAARDRERAAAYAERRRIPRVLPTYEDVVHSPDIDAVYIPTPASLHGYRTRRALAAGKHVLCEKPFTANAQQAVEIAELADRSDRRSRHGMGARGRR